MTLPLSHPDAALVRDPVEELAEVFLDRYRRGERPSLSEFIARAPEHAEEIRELFPALVLMEQADAASTPKASAPHALLNLERLGDYRLLREVGRGGMGIVYEAVQEALGRHVALKILLFSADPRCLMRFRREARSAARLHHTNIVPVFDIGEREGIHFYAMQFIQGQGLDEVIAELQRLRLASAPEAAAVSKGDGGTVVPGPAANIADSLRSGQFLAPDLDNAYGAQNGERSPSENSREEPELASKSALGAPDSAKPSVLTEQSDFSTKSDFQFYRSVARIGLQVAEALAYAHGQRVLHRDIKPSNLLLDARGCVWVTDFGLAKEGEDGLTRTGDVVGTLRYMAPERLNGVSEPRSDVYGLGLTLYELLTLQPAFPESDRARLVERITRQEPVTPRKLNPQVPRDLETIVLKAIAKEPPKRYASAEDMEEDLRRFLMDRPIRARRISQWERTWRWCRRNPGWASTIAAVLGLLLFIFVAGGIFNLNLQQALRDVQTADREKTEKLWQAYLERARALRSSGRVGQRFETLITIREAAKIKMTPELRDEAVAALVLPDIELAREWQGFPEDSLSLAHDASLMRYARMNKKGDLTICRLTEHGEDVVARLPAHGKPPFWGIWMSQDGRYLAYGHSSLSQGSAGAVRIWKLDGAVPTVYADDPTGVHLHALSFHADGRRLAIGHVNGTINLYDLQSKEPPRRLTLGQIPYSLAFHPRDSRLAAACGDSVRLFDVSTGKEMPALRLPNVQTWSNGLAWQPNGDVLAATSDDKKIHMWDTRTGTEATLPLPHTGSGIFMAFNQKGDRLISSGWDKQSWLWDAVTGRLLLTIPSKCGGQFGPDGALLGLGVNGTKLQLWRLADGRELRRLHRPTADDAGQLHLPVFDATGRILAAGTGYGMSFFDLGSGRELASIQSVEPMTVAPRRFHAQGGWMTSGDTGTLRWPTKQDPIHQHILHIGPPQSLAATVHAGADATPDGRITVVPQGNQTLVISRDDPEHRIILKAQYDVRNAAVSPDGRWVATFSWWVDARSKGVRIWEAATGRHVVDLSGEGLANGSFSPDGRWLAVYTADQGCQVWEVGAWRVGKRFNGAVCWYPNGRFLAVSDILGAIRLVEPDTAREVLRLTAPEALWYLPTCFTPDGATLLAQTSDGNGILVYDLRLIREQLATLGMDWDLPALPPPADSDSMRPSLTVELNPGFLRQPTFKNDRDAVATFSIALALQPLNPEAYLQRGLANGRLKQPQLAVSDYEMFLALTPATDRRRPEVNFRIATNYQNLKDTSKALAALLKVASAPPELVPWPRQYALLCNELAWQHVKVRLDKPLAEAALRLAESAVHWESHNLFYQNTFGVALYRSGRHEEAVRCLEVNLGRSQQYIAFDLYFLAMSHQGLGEPAKALAYLDRANAAAKAAPNLSAAQRAELAAFRMESEEALGISKMK